MRILADTNILLRRVQRTNPHHRDAWDAVTRIAGRGDVLCVTAQNLIEFWAVCTRPLENNGLGLLQSDVSAFLSEIEDLAILLSDDTNSVYKEWRALVARHGVSGKKSHDARLVAAMHVHGLSHILTFNTQDFTRYPGIVALNPRDVSAAG